MKKTICILFILIFALGLVGCNTEPTIITEYIEVPVETVIVEYVEVPIEVYVPIETVVTEYVEVEVPIEIEKEVIVEIEVEKIVEKEVIAQFNCLTWETVCQLAEGDILNNVIAIAAGDNTSYE